MPYVHLNPAALARNPAQFGRAMQHATALYRAANGRNPRVLPVPAKRRGVAGLGANPYPGTYSDVNCPTKCYLAGNLLDTSLFGQDCWPCHNICPVGSVWDTANLVCSGSPEATNPQSPVPGGPGSPTDQSGCPGYCGWLPFASSLFSECQPCQGQTGAPSGLSTSALVIGGLVLGVFLFGGRR